MSLPRVAAHSLEASCASSYKSRGLALGVESVQVRLDGRAFSPHSHDTYTIVVTTEGVQEFTYRGSTHRSVPGDVVILHPGERHDGRAGQGHSFAYVGLQVESVTAWRYLAQGGISSLPFVGTPVVEHAQLATLANFASTSPAEDLLTFQLLCQVMESLCELAGLSRSAMPVRCSGSRLEVAEEYIREHADEQLLLKDLERACGLSTYEICRQFKRRYGVSPYKHLLMRRVAMAKEKIRGGLPLAQVAASVGFSDQAHMTRAFRTYVGLTPGAYAALRSADSAGAKQQRYNERSQLYEEAF